MATTKTISTTVTTGVSLSSSYTQVSVTSTGKVTKTGLLNTSALYITGSGSNTVTVTNSGVILGLTSGTVGAIGLNIGGNGGVAKAVVTNNSGGTIQGYAYGVLVNGPGTIINKSGGLIAATTNDAVEFSRTGSVINYGVIRDSLANGVYFLGSGSVTNAAGATISAGNYGIQFDGGAGTVTNAGVIISTHGAGAGAAVDFNYNTAANLLIVDPGASFVGTINGGAGELELASGASAGTLSGFGATSITNFGSLQFASGAAWTVVGDASGLGTMEIGGFTAHDTIELTGFTASGDSFVSTGTTGLVLTRVSSGTTSQATLHIQGALTTSDFHVSTANGASYITVCLCRGTPIETPCGPVPVETLRVGDSVRARFAGEAPVRWIGRRRIDCRQHPQPAVVWPVRVRAHAFGPGVPARDVLVSPNHALWVEDALIPARLLVNGAAIARVPVAEVEYFHVELPQHDVLLSAGLGVESYLECGDRRYFESDDETIALFPDFDALPPDAALIWETRGCGPLVLTGPVLEAARRRVHGYAGNGQPMAA